jgi:hypothetical protein
MSYASANPTALGAAITGLGFVASAEGRHERLARLWGIAARLRRQAGGGSSRRSEIAWGDPERAARQAIGDALFEQRHAEGQAMSLDAAVAYARSLDESPQETGMEEYTDA